MTICRSTVSSHCVFHFFLSTLLMPLHVLRDWLTGLYKSSRSCRSEWLEDTWRNHPFS